MKWHKFDHTDLTTYPTEHGMYAVMIAGDSEYLEGHCLYDFPDYRQFCEFGKVDEDENGNEHLQFFPPMYGEEIDSIIAWYGPIHIPPIDWERINSDAKGEEYATESKDSL